MRIFGISCLLFMGVIDVDSAKFFLLFGGWSWSIRESVDGCLPVYVSGTQQRAGKSFLVGGVGVVLGLEA